MWILTASAFAMLQGMVLIGTGSFNMGNVTNNTNDTMMRSRCTLAVISHPFLMQQTENAAVGMDFRDGEAIPASSKPTACPSSR